MRRADRRSCLVATAWLALVIVGAWLSTPAHADPQSNYAQLNAAAICSTLDEYPTVAGVTGVLSAVMEESGFTAYESGGVIATAVIGYCPEHLPELRRFIAVFSDNANSNYAATTPSGHVGGVIS